MPIRIFRDADDGRRFIMRRREMRDTELSAGMREGVRRIFGEDLSAHDVVRRILDDIRKDGDDALRKYTRSIDRADITDFEVTEAEIDAAFESVPADVIEALRFSAGRIEAFHKKQRIGSWIEFDDDGALGQIVRPLDRVGVYAPGGTAPYPSSLMMAAVPARVAGVEEVIVCAPPEPGGRIAPVTLVAARISGVDRVYAAGGAQAIAAMAYGTHTIPKADKILGPGNIFVVLAKQMVYGDVDIESLPGPTETVVIADDSATPELCAADLLAQAEHDPMASAILITSSRELAEKVSSTIDQQLRSLTRRNVIEQSLENNGAVIVTEDIGKAFDIANDYAPEHLCLLTADPWSQIGLVKHAGGIFIGEHSPEVIGDYTAGPSHIMPTGRTARFASPVNVLDFVKIISVVGLNEGAMRRVGPPAAKIARAESLTAHAAAIDFRLQRDRDE
ncbi:MAG: histidinol dehydrogenase [Chloroflexota bacterium]